MLKKAVALLILTAGCIHASAQGWKFDPRVGGIQEKMANSTIKLDIVKPIGKWTGTGITGPANNTRAKGDCPHSI